MSEGRGVSGGRVQVREGCEWGTGTSEGRGVSGGGV